MAGVLGGDGAIDEPIGRASSVVVSFPGVALAAAAMVKGLLGVKCFAQRCVRPPVAPTRAATTTAAMRITRVVRDAPMKSPSTAAQRSNGASTRQASSMHSAAMRLVARIPRNSPG